MKGERTIDLKKLCFSFVAICLAPLIVLSYLRFEEVRTIDSAITAAATALEKTDLPATLDALAKLHDADLEPSENQADEIRRVLRESVILALRKNPLIRKVGGRKVRSGVPSRVASPQPIVELSVEPAALRTWISTVRIGAQSIPVTSSDTVIHRALTLNLDDGLEEKAFHLPIEVSCEGWTGEIPPIPLGMLSVTVDRRRPAVVIGEGPEVRKLTAPTSERVLLKTLPGKVPVISIHDHVGLLSVRWRVNGSERSKGFPEPVKRWSLELDEQLFAQDGSDVKVIVIPRNVLGNANEVELGFAVRGPAYNPVRRILVNGQELTANSTLEVETPRVKVTLELREGEDGSKLSLRSGGRKISLERHGNVYGAEVRLDEGKPTGISILSGDRVLKSYSLRVNGNR